MSENEKLVVVDDDYCCITVEKFLFRGVNFFNVLTVDKESALVYSQVVGPDLIFHLMRDFLDQEDVREFIDEVV